MELLGAEVDRPDVTVASLFEGVTLESPNRTLWRAAIVFAGRIPTEEEYASIETGTESDLRRAIRGLMEGAGFHEFLIRAANDRLLTDRVLGSNHDPISVDGYFVSFFREFYRLEAQAEESDEVWRNFNDWAARSQYGAARAPLELIAHVVEKDLPYTEILTANYVLANSWAAQAYVDDSVEFVDPDNVHEFTPARIRGYFRKGESYPGDYRLCGPEESPAICDDVLETDWPHAGVLNTLSFLQRYPTTATNRNRARSRWTYYHFLGDDIEKSAARTMKQEVLADRNNPTMNNEACTVCHERMDPVAGAFQNFGNAGLYRDQSGGLDSLDGFYKRGDGNAQFRSITARSWEDRETVSVEAWFTTGSHTVGLATRSLHNIHVDYLAVRNAEGMETRQELEDSDDRECGSVWTGNTYELVHCPLIVDIEVPATGNYVVETAAYVGYDYDEVPGRPAKLAIWAPYDENYQQGDTWYRDMRAPGFGGRVMPEDVNDRSLRWLAGRIIEDERFATAVVEFWWSPIMGSEVAEQPEEESDVDYEVRKLAADAQTDQIRRLAGGFRRGFSWSDAGPYNLKDLLVEIAMSKWFRAESLEVPDGIRAGALRDAGARRLLTPEEVASKTASLTGYQWGRGTEIYLPRPHTDGYSALTNEEKYRLFYGGIDSNGITERARDLTSVMAGVAQRHAVASSCPIVFKGVLPAARRETAVIRRNRHVHDADFRGEHGRVIRGASDQGQDR